MQRILLLTILIIFSIPGGHLSVYGQWDFSGRVLDGSTGEPLAFVNIVYNRKGTGTTTSIEGYFSIKADQPPFMRLSYVGYEPLTIYPDSKGNFPTVISMERKPVLIEEVTVKPGINPAHRIIVEAFRNRNRNDPERLTSFSYTSYNKIFFTLLPDSVVSQINLPQSPNISMRFAFSGNTEPDEQNRMPEDTLKSENADSSEIKMREFLEKQHLFLMESVSEREYMNPGRNNETVIASRVSGFSDPSFTLLATQIQSFSFYEDFISILDRRYLNPISRGSTSRYSFILEDSMFTEMNDTLFIISFRPYPDRNFDGLTGVVYINSNGYAVQNVIAGPAGSRDIFTVRIQQNYNLVDGIQWFPAELNTDIIFGQESVSAGSGTNYSLVGIGKTYLSDIKIEPELRKRDFNNIELTISPDGHRRTEEFWERYRVEDLTGKDTMTYHVVDSIGREANFDRSLKILEALATGYVPWGVFNIDYTELLDFNYFEGLRPGLRLVTNERVSERFSLGGNIAVGSKDGKVKYGGEAGLLIHRRADMDLKFSYLNDVEEAGTYSFLDSGSPVSSESYRRFNIGRMDYVRQFSSSVRLHLMRHFKAGIYLSNSVINSGDGYVFLDDGVMTDRFRITEAGIKVRFAFREKFMQTPKGNRISMGTDFPLIWFNYGRGLDFADGRHEYSRIVGRFYQSFATKRLGKTSVQIEGGKVDSDVPMQKLFNGNGNYRPFSLDAANSFATMRMTEFASDEFISVFFRQNFESLLFRTENFRPELVFITNAGYGRLDKPGNHLNVDFKSMEKGYFESGLLINNIYRKLILGYGVGIYYRYGPYAFDTVIDNFAFKLAFNINIR